MYTCVRAINVLSHCMSTLSIYSPFTIPFLLLLILNDILTNNEHITLNELENMCGKARQHQQQQQNFHCGKRLRR